MNLGQLRRWWHGRYHTTRRRPAKEAGPSRQGTVEELVAKTDKQGNPKQQRSRQETCANLEDWRPQPPSMCVCDRDARKLRAYGKSVRHQVFPGRDSKIVSPFVVGQHQSAPLSSSNFSRNYDFNFMSANVSVPPNRAAVRAKGRMARSRGHGVKCCAARGWRHQNSSRMRWNNPGCSRLNANSLLAVPTGIK